jgi:dTDP-4-dehydrorhamnose 3,5-epimerase
MSGRFEAAAMTEIFTDPLDKTLHIYEVGVRRLTVNRDPRGILVETLRTDWSDIFHSDERPFAQTYYSITEPNVARDENDWHVHERQEDRFAVLSGDMVLGLHDPRPDSPTNGWINLFRMGESLGDDGQIAVLIPKLVHHGFLVGPDHPAVLTNFPTRIYDPGDEGRVPFDQVGARMRDGPAFSWDLVRKSLGGQTAKSGSQA